MSRPPALCYLLLSPETPRPHTMTVNIVTVNGTGDVVGDGSD